MMLAIDLFVLVAATLLFVPTALFVTEVGAGLWPRRARAAQPVRSGAGVDIIIPAHDEEAGIARTIRNIRAQTRPRDRVIVVADNCRDDTAVVAAAEGARVFVRDEPTRRGKGYALQFGVESSAADAREIVVFLDADCVLADYALERLVGCCEARRRPAQSLYAMVAPAGAKVNLQVAEFAWRVRNDVRPSGMSVLGWPCQLMGTGMAIPRSLLHDVDLRTGEIVEDLRLGLDLARAGHPPVFCRDALVASEFPASAKGISEQRQRWEGGHLRLAVSQVPSRLLSAVRDRHWSTALLALDLAVPPVALFAMLHLVVTTLAASIFFWSGGGAPALVVSAFDLALFVGALSAAWITVGRACLPARSIGRVVPYAFAKTGLYARALVGRKATGWIRAERS